MVDQKKLDQMLGNLSKYVRELERLSRLPSPAFLADPDKVASAKYHFVVAIECCIDIANHVIASERFRFPTSNADSFNVLVEQSIVVESQAIVLKQMASFRNRLVHQYWEVDNQLVLEILQSDLGDFETFAMAIARAFA